MAIDCVTEDDDSALDSAPGSELNSAHNRESFDLVKKTRFVIIIDVRGKGNDHIFRVKVGFPNNCEFIGHGFWKEMNTSLESK